MQCAKNFADGDGATFKVSDWFSSQPENKAEDPLVDGYLPKTGSSLTLGDAAVGDAFFDVVDFAGAFKDASHDWTKEWTFPF